MALCACRNRIRERNTLVPIKFLSCAPGIVSSLYIARNCHCFFIISLKRTRDSNSIRRSNSPDKIVRKIMYNPRYLNISIHIYIYKNVNFIRSFFSIESNLNLFKSKEILTKNDASSIFETQKGANIKYVVKMVKMSVRSYRKQNSIGIPSLSSELIIVFVVTLSRAFQLQKNHWPIVSQNPFTHSTDTFRCS